MKIRINLQNKIIQLGELYDFILKAFPDQWRDFNIEVVPTIQNFTNTIYVPYNPPYWTYGTLPLWVAGEYPNTIRIQDSIGNTVLNFEIENQNTTFEPAY